MNLSRLVLACFLCLLTLGCASRERKVTGAVTWDGQPLKDGTINLIPLDPTIPAVSAKIVNGAYEVLALPGMKKVEIYASRSVGEFLPHMGMAAQEMYIPEEYNARSTLTADVSATGDNQFSFELVKPKTSPSDPAD